jgi:hypothetical protein
VTDFTADPSDGAILETAGAVTVTVSYTEEGVTKTIIFTVDVQEILVPPTISGPESLIVIEGYTAASTGAYTVTGTGPVAVTIDNNHGGKITWDDETKKLFIVEGLAAGTYTVILTASNGIDPNAALAFTMTIISASPTPTPTPTPTPIVSGGGSTRNAEETPAVIPDVGPPLAEPDEQWFEDVKKKAWYYDSVYYVYNNGLMNGTSSTPMLFSPNAALTRGMIVTILYRASGTPDVSGFSNPFNDVPEGEWYTEAVKWAAANEIINGYGAGKYGPDDNVIREQLAAILMRYAEFLDKELPKEREYTGFADERRILSYAKDAVIALYSASIINGRQGNIFDPQGIAARAEIAAMLQRFLEAK